jgi:two-component system sensor histidine kinase CpxA
MKTPKLYLKFFLTFLGIFIVTEILIFSFFHFVIGKKMAAHMADVNKYALSQLIEDKLSRTPGVNPQDNQQLRKLLKDLGKVYHAKVWITDNENTLCSSEYTPNAPDTLCRNDGRRMFAKDSFPSKSGRFFSAPVTFPDGRKGIIHMALKRPPARPQDMTFALGLAGIGVIIALMLFPLYRFISKPLGELRKTAQVIASGDLSARASVKSSDEIGELAKAFNIMADNVENMIKSTRELTANISHELRSPLARIRVAEELLEGKLDDKQSAKRYIESIKEETDEIDRLIGNILRLSRLDMNAAAEPRKDFDLAELLSGLISRWNASFEHSGINLEYNAPESPVIINGQPEEIVSAIDNLIANALKFTAEKGMVSILLAKTDKTTAISVKNTYENLCEKHLEKIFEPFYRIPGSGSTGAGLGLTIARKIVMNNGGSLNARAFKDGIEIVMEFSLC